MFEFAWMWAFYLAPLPFLIKRFVTESAPQQPSALQVPFLDDIAQSQGADSNVLTRKASLWWLAFAIWLCLIAALARPQWAGEPVADFKEGRELMLAIDLSASMQERDFEFKGQRLDRLTATRLVANDFIQRRAGDRIGLVLFGDLAYLQAPLTFDLKTVEQLLAEAQIGLAGDSTAIGDAIGISVKRLRESENPNKVLILLTDGTNTAGALQPLQAAEIAASEGIRIYTIGIGSEGQGQGLLGRFFQRSAAELDAKTLTSIAEQTGGKFYRARDVDELADIYKQLDQVEPIERAAGFIRPIQALYQWPLALAVLLMVVLALLKGRALRQS